MQSFFYDSLRQKIKETAKVREITVATTYYLEELIAETIQERVSATTLQRLFGLISNQSKLREATLDVLARYVGYRSWQHFCKKEQDTLSQSKDIQLEKVACNGEGESAKKFLFNLTEKALLARNYDLILSFVEDWQTPPDKNVNTLLTGEAILIRQLAENIMLFCLKDKQAGAYLLQRLAKMRAGQYYFYERIVCEKESRYIQAIEQYYLPHVEFKNIDYGIQDYCFAQALLFERHLARNEKKKMIAKGNEWFKRVPPELELFERLRYTPPYSRYHSNYLIWLYHTEQLTKKKSTKWHRIFIRTF